MADIVSATFLIPQESAAPLRIEFRHEAIEMVVVDRDQWGPDVSSRWRTSGVYLLFGPPDDEESGRYSVYVGRSSSGTVASRLVDHVKNKEGWDRALLVRRASAAGFNSTDVGWLEGRIYDVVANSGFADVRNRNTPGDDTIADWDREALERVTTLIRSVMRVLGFRTDTPPTDLPPAEDDVSNGQPRFDMEFFHRVVSLVEPGEWTTYGDVARVIGSHARGLGAHIRSCSSEAPEWRILNKRGESQPGFTWTTRNHVGSQLDVLSDEGIAIVDDLRADPGSKVEADVLRRRLKDEA